MGANLDITEKLQNYINDFGLNLHPVQQEIINYNKTLGDIKRMQIDPAQCHFLHLIMLQRMYLPNALIALSYVR